MCSDGTRYLLGWEDYRDPPALRVRRDGRGGKPERHERHVGGQLNDMVAPMLDACAPGAFLAVHGEDSVQVFPVAAQQAPWLSARSGWFLSPALANVATWWVYQLLAA